MLIFGRFCLDIGRNYSDLKRDFSPGMFATSNWLATYVNGMRKREKSFGHMYGICAASAFCHSHDVGLAGDRQQFTNAGEALLTLQTLTRIRVRRSYVCE